MQPGTASMFPPVEQWFGRAAVLGCFWHLAKGFCNAAVFLSLPACFISFFPPRSNVCKGFTCIEGRVTGRSLSIKMSVQPYCIVCFKKILLVF